MYWVKNNIARRLLFRIGARLRNNEMPLINAIPYPILYPTWAYIAVVPSWTLMRDVLYNMKMSNVQKTWTNRDVVSSDTIRLCTQVKELIEIRDSCTTEHLNYFECKTMIDYLCTC